MYKITLTETTATGTQVKIVKFYSLAVTLRVYSELFIRWKLGNQQPPAAKRTLKISKA